MSTWNTIARNRRVEWRRKQTWGPFGPGFGISLELDTSRWDRAFTPTLQRGPNPAYEAWELTMTARKYVETLMEIPRKMGMGEILRIGLGDCAEQPEGPPYTHTYTVGPPWIVGPPESTA